jgi:hypothetical protein
MLSLFMPLGMNLSPQEKQSFDEIREQIDRCSNEILDKPDWGANIQCCDLISAAPTQAV